MELIQQPPQQKKSSINFQQLDDFFAGIYYNDNDENETTTVSIHSFIAIIKACAKIGSLEAAEAAEHFVWEWMMAFYNDNRLDEQQIQPHIFSLLVQAWITSRHPTSGKRAEQILTRLEEWTQQEQQGEGGDILPVFVVGGIPTAFYGAVMKAYAIHGDYQNAYEVFDKCRQAFEEGNAQARPNKICWNTLLDACAKASASSSNSPTVVWRVANEYMKQFQNDYYHTGLVEEPPDTYTYVALMKICANCNQPHRTEFWLNEMYRDFVANGNTTALPNQYAFNIAMDAWAQSTSTSSQSIQSKNNNNNNNRTDLLHKEGAKKSEQILKWMISLSKSGSLPTASSRPNTINYCTVINAYAKRGQPKMAEYWHDEMVKDWNYGYGNKDAQPNTHTYNIVLDAWSNTGTLEGAIKCEKIIRYMIQLSSTTSTTPPKQKDRNNKNKKDGDDDDDDDTTEFFFPAFVLPNHHSYNIVIDAFAKCKDGGNQSADKAEYWLSEMFKAYYHGVDGEGVGGSGRRRRGRGRGGNKSARPNMDSFLSVLKARAAQEVQLERRAGETTTRGAVGEKCEAILDSMKKIYEETDLHVRPNTLCYNIVINAYAQEGRPNEAERVLQKQLDDYTRGGNNSAPLDIESFTWIINGWVQQQSKEEEETEIISAGEKAESVLDLAQELYQQGILQEGPNYSMYLGVIKAWLASNLEEEGNNKHDWGKANARAVLDRILEDYKQQETTNIRFNDGDDHDDANAPFSALIQAYCKSSSAGAPAAAAAAAIEEKNNLSAGELADAVLREMRRS